MAGFTMVELITVFVLMGILGGIGYARFADTTSFSNRSYADQAKGIIRYAQKLAITQGRAVFVRSEPGGFAVCFASGCPNAAALAAASGGSNSGSSATRAYCILGGAYVSNWMCEARPNTSVTVTSNTVRPEFGAGGFFFFDSLGRPYNSADTVGSSSFTRMILTFTSGTSTNAVTIEAETGYVH
ncbi:MSHA biogenesis protein MshC [Duganella sp. FT135W]|uniref:MSHA biogenesis protein MshC n=1 Tax=Duganella flavida TaxID=2692175 RepID=A0A6L8KF92_9BURK|nr:MSHA biogenesis protein MshC [Duganella flavida]MYM26129.1 MSHA biogenesis protein MshC [Duganella flavida]